MTLEIYVCAAYRNLHDDVNVLSFFGGEKKKHCFFFFFFPEENVHLLYQELSRMGP